MPSNHLILCYPLLLLPSIFMVMIFKPSIRFFLAHEDILTGEEQRLWPTCKLVCVCVWTFYIKIFHIRKCGQTHITDGHCTGRTEACPGEDQSPGACPWNKGWLWTVVTLKVRRIWNGVSHQTWRLVVLLRLTNIPVKSAARLRRTAWTFSQNLHWWPAVLPEVQMRKQIEGSKKEQTFGSKEIFTHFRAWNQLSIT